MDDERVCPICSAGQVIDCVEVVEIECSGQKVQSPSRFQLCRACGSDFVGAIEMRANKVAVMALRDRVGSDHVRTV